MLKKLLHTQNMFISAIEIFLHRNKVSKHSQKMMKDGNFWPDFGLILPWCQKIHSCSSWSAPFFFLCVLRPWFKMRCVPMFLEKLLHIQKMFISAIENFYIDVNCGFFAIAAKSSQNQVNNFLLSAFSEGVFWLYVDVKNFLWHLWTCSGYVKVSSEAGEHSAFCIRDVRHIEKKRRASGQKLSKKWHRLTFNYRFHMRASK